jgi:hypothetical protein
MANLNVLSKTVSGTTEPFDLQVARGQIVGHTGVEIFGYTPNIANTAFGPMWEGQTQSGGLYTYPGAAAPLVLVSTSTSDTSALSVRIEGCGAGFVPLVETIALNGTTNVTTTNSFLRINAIYVTNGTNIGTITAKISSTTYAQINPGVGQTQMSIYTVPAGYTFYLSYTQYDAAIGFTSSAYMTGQEYNKDNVSGQVTVTHQTVFVQKQETPFTSPIAHTEKTDLQFCVKSSSGGPLTCSMYAGGYLIQDTQ